MIETVNLAAAMDEDDLKKVARTVIDDFNADLDSRSEWLEIHSKWIDLYYQNDKPINPPWVGASDESLPLLAEAVNLFHSRAYKAMFPGKNVVKAVPTALVDDNALKRAERVTRHMNWQLMTRDRTYRHDKDNLIQSTALHGSCFTKTYPDFDPYRPKITNVRAQDLVLPYGVGPRHLEDIERKTEILHVSVSRTRALAHSGFFIAPAEPYAVGDNDEMTEAVDQATGVQDSGLDVGGRPAQLLEQHRLLDLDDDGEPEPYTVTVCRQSGRVLRICARYEVRDGKKRPIEYYTQYDFIRNSDGVYGLGMGHLIGKINQACNKLLRQMIDAAELSNIGNLSGFISDQVGIPGEDLEFDLGSFKKVRNNGGAIGEGIFQFKFPGPQPFLGEAVSLLMARGDRLATTTEALTGQTNRDMQPTTVLALIEQGMQSFNGPITRLLESQALELDKVYRLNRLYLPNEEYFAVLDGEGTPEAAVVARNDYADDLQIEPVADPNQATDQQRMARAEAELNFARTSPLIMNDPTMLYTFERSYLEALGTRDLDQKFPPPAEREPDRVDDPTMENMGALLPVPQVPPVHQDQNHLEHVRAHDGLLNDPDYGAQMTPDGRAALEAHRQTHIAFLYGLTEGNLAEMMDDDEAGQVGDSPDAPVGGGPVAGGMAAPGIGAGSPGAPGRSGAPNLVPATGPGSAAQANRG